MGLAAVFTLVMLLWPDAVYRAFTPDADVLAAAGVLTLPIILNFYGAATRSAAFSLINGSGRPKLNLAIALIDGVIARIGLAALLGFALGLDCFGFWMGDALAGFMPLMIGGTFFLSGRWKENAVRA
jgi:Na+-driven multidrug efflux pump